MRWFYWTIGTGLGSGFSPVAPGTAGSVVGVLLAFFLIPSTGTLFIFLTLLTFAIGTLAAHYIAHTTGQEDPQVVVIDEVVGVWIALWWIPQNWLFYLLALAFFRVFDIWKPFPVKWAEQFNGGVGIMLDDVIAGFYALATLHILLLFI